MTSRSEVLKEGEQMPMWNQYILYVELARMRREVPMEYDEWILLNAKDMSETGYEAE
jgi:hypothetical protein